MLELFWPGIEPVSQDEHRDAGLIESALARPVQTFDGELLIQGIERQGAALFHSLIANHPFENGNKRTAIVALDLFLMANGRCLILDADEIHDLAVETASYREQDKGHEEILAEIESALQGAILPFAELGAPLAARLTRIQENLTANACTVV